MNLNNIGRIEYNRLFHEGVETAERQGASDVKDVVVILQGIIEEETVKHETELMNVKCEVSNRDTEITKLNELVDKLIADNTDLKRYIEELTCKWN